MDRSKEIQELRKGNIVFMLVEDDYDQEVIVSRVVKNSKIAKDLVFTRNGKEALDYIFGEGSYSGRDISIMPEIILLDLKLPKIGGFEVLKRLKSDIQTKDIPVVVYSSSCEEADKARSYQLGAYDYIDKPLDTRKFEKIIKGLGFSFSTG